MSLKISEIATEVRDSYIPKNEEDLHYIGLEHVEQQTLHLSSIGISQELESNKFRFKTGDILFGTLRPYFRKVIIAPCDGICSTEFCVVRSKSLTDRNFVFYVLANPIFISYATANSKGDRPRTKWKLFSNFELTNFLPSQRENIGYVLSAYDDLIENNRRRIQLLEKSAQLLYNEWFVNLRFPGHEHTKIVNGIPQGWKIARLDRIAAINEKTLKKGFTEKIEYIDISSVKPGSIDETLQYNFEDAPGRARRIVNHGDIIWSCVRPNRRSHAIIWKPCLNLIASTGFVVITPKEVMTAFLYQALTTNEYVGYLTNNAKGVAYPAVTAKDFAKSEILIPSRQPLIEFNEIATQILEQINTLRVQNRKLAQARDILLPRLMNGELAV